jgi:crossover junction endodeoxyribonuclease RuvC
MRILGVDPGSLKTGWGVVDMAPDGTVSHVDNGMVGAHEDTALPLRLCKIAAGLSDVIARYRPACCSVETAYHAKNPRSALVLGQARGAAVLTCAQAGLTVFEYGPMQVKLAVTGTGRAGKESVQHMVATLMKLPEIAQQDASDALALALTHAFLIRRPAAIIAAQPKGPSRRAKKGSRGAWEDLLRQRGVVG